MKISQNGIKFLKEVEGWECNVYKDVAGLATIGVGHLLTKQELMTGRIILGLNNVSYEDGLSDSQVDQLLDQDLDSFEEAVNDLVKVDINQDQFDCLVSFSFNVGVSAFRNSTLLRLLNSGQKDEVPNQLRRWNKAGGKVISGLINRREKEIKLWRGV